MVTAANLGFPRIGARRELKKATESYWKKKISAAELQQKASDLRQAHWHMQKEAGIDVIPSNDFSFYDQMLDTTAMLGAVPKRFGKVTQVDFPTYFAMARGTDNAFAMEMTKWFDTNYHYIVPELSGDLDFHWADRKVLEQFIEAQKSGIITRPVLIGPVTWLLLAKAKDDNLAPLSLLDKILPIYQQVLNALAEAGAQWVQIDEPILATDIDEEARKALQKTYEVLQASPLKIMLASYFDSLGENLQLLKALPVAGIHIDRVRGADPVQDVISAAGDDKVLSLGLIDGRNIWRADLSRKLEEVTPFLQALGQERLQIAPSNSLLHVPVDLQQEEKLDEELKSWLAFAKQKLNEISALAQAASGNRVPVEAAFTAADAAIKARNSSTRIHNPVVKERMKTINADMTRRQSAYAVRRKAQEAAFGLPLYPTTTIGSFPQTQEIRQARAAHRRGELDNKSYDDFLAKATEETVRLQEEIGLDVLVHGEFERNDMVEYFGEQLEGFAFTQFGWVQSYGSRYVKPPIIFGDVSRPHPMTVRWTAYAQSLTKKWMKGMLTGPVTILQWSFVRDDQPRSRSCEQIALAIRDEVHDLEAAGIKIIQIDEPAFREGLPLRTKDWPAYLDWATTAFRLSASCVEDTTQIHTHMCYSEFNDIIQSIADLDADVISIETSRSDMELLDAFVDFRYPNEIGPGVWDIHSPRVPALSEMQKLLEKAVTLLRPEQIWVNPDCGLKTRDWPEVKAALTIMVEAAQNMRQKNAA